MLECINQACDEQEIISTSKTSENRDQDQYTRRGRYVASRENIPHNVQNINKSGDYICSISSIQR